jgi:hypothetical protein
MTFPLEEVSLSRIDIASGAYRISKQGCSDRLCESVVKHGILEPPALVRIGGGFIPFTGHNRLEAAASAGMTAVVCRVLDEPDKDVFLNNAVLKHFRGELGVVGRIRAAKIAAGMNGSEFPSVDIVSSLELPLSLASSISGILSLDDSLLLFCDQKSVPLKTILLLESFPFQVAAAVSTWVTGSAVRMNMFKIAVDLLSDLLRTADPAVLCRVVSENAAQPDDVLVTSLYALRNPVISQMNLRAEKIVSAMKRNHIDLIYPPFFEGNSVECRVRIQRADKGASCRKSLEFLSASDLSEILDLL